MIKAIIFDHDGVIADTEPIHFKADNLVLSQFGVSISEQENESMVGLSTHQSWVMLKEMFQIPKPVDWLIQEKVAAAMEIIDREGIEANEGLLALLEDLKSNGYPLAIGSGNYREVIHAVTTKLDIGDYFQVIVSVEDISRGKPDPEVFLQAASRLGVKPVECLVIEDSESGVAAAKAAGMACIALKTPSTTHHDLSRADQIVSSLQEIRAQRLLGR